MIKKLRLTLLLPAIMLCFGCTKEPDKVSFKNDIMPIFKQNCSVCHLEGGMGYNASGFSVESYESIMKGTKFGPVIQAGKSVSSTLKVLLEHKADPKINMPKQAPKLSDDKIQLISKWIDQGAKNN